MTSNTAISINSSMKLIFQLFILTILIAGCTKNGSEEVYPDAPETAPAEEASAEVAPGEKSLDLSDNNNVSKENVEQVLLCQSAKHVSDKTVIILYSNNKADYIPYSGQGIFNYPLEEKTDYSKTDFTITIQNRYYQKVELNRTSLILSMMRKAPLFNSTGETYDDWREYSCSLSDNSVAETALMDLKNYKSAEESEMQGSLSDRKI